MASTPAKASWFTSHEIPRKILHGSIAILSTALYVNGIQQTQVTPVLISMLIPISILEAIRFMISPINRIFIALFGSLMRESEKNGRVINGVIWYLVGLIIVFSLFPKDICLVAIYLLSWADLAASTMGRAYGRFTPKLVGQKSLAGTLAAFITGTLSTIFIYKILIPPFTEYNPPSVIMYNEKLSKISVWQLSLVMGLAAALTELFPLLDDNFSIPVGSAFIQWIVIKITTLPYSYGVLA